MSEDGAVLTAAHIVSDNEPIFVSDGIRKPGRFYPVIKNLIEDVAVLSVQNQETSLFLGHEPAPGHWVGAMVKNRPWLEGWVIANVECYCNTDKSGCLPGRSGCFLIGGMPIKAGDSGAGLIDYENRLVGFIAGIIKEDNFSAGYAIGRGAIERAIQQ